MSNLLQASPYAPQSTGTSSSLLLHRACLRPGGCRCGCAAQAPSGRRGCPLPGQKPLTRKRTRDGGRGPAVVCERVRAPPGPQGWRLASDRSAASGRPNFPGAQAPAAPEPTGCVLRRELLGLSRTAPGAVLDTRGGARGGAAGRRRGAAARGRVPAGPAAAAAAAAASWARPPRGCPRPASPRPGRGQRARRRRSALP